MSKVALEPEPDASDTNLEEKDSGSKLTNGRWTRLEHLRFC